MLSKRQEEQRKLRKQSILEGALKVFKTHGIEKTTMDEIALESGFGKATLYYYFASKDEVFIAIMEEGWEQLVRTAFGPPNNLTTWRVHQPFLQLIGDNSNAAIPGRRNPCLRGHPSAKFALSEDPGRSDVPPARHTKISSKERTDDPSNFRMALWTARCSSSLGSTR